MSSKHPERSASGATLQSITELSHDKQVELLSDALLREYMHKRGFRGTLKAFDQEHPRDEHTISSRALMSELMALQSSDQQRFKKDNIETIMEMLCALRIERRQRVSILETQANEPLPVISDEEQKLLEKEETINHFQEDNQSGKVTKAKEAKIKSAHVSSQSENSEDTQYEEESEESSELELSEDVSESDDNYDNEGGMTIDDLLSDNNENREQEKAHHAISKSAMHKNTKRKDSKKKTKRQLQDELMPTPPKSNSKITNAGHATQLSKNTSNKKKSTKHSNKTSKQHHMHRRHDNDSSNDDDDDNDDTSDVESEESETTTTLNEDDEYVSSEDDDDDDIDRECREDGGDEVSHEELQKVFLALFGAKTSGKSYMVYTLCQQGFVYDNIIEYALVELEHEPNNIHNNNNNVTSTGTNNNARRDDVQSDSHLSLILSTVQAFIIAYYFERSAYTETTIRQRDCLCRAVVTILTTAQPDVRKVVLVNGKLPQRHSAK